MNIDDLTHWARRAAADLSDYAKAAAEAGTPQANTEALIAELDDILAGRPVWQRRYAEQCTEPSKLACL